MTRRSFVFLLLLIVPVASAGQTFVGTWSDAYHAVGIEGTPRVALEFEGHLVIGGWFTSAGDVMCQNIVRHTGDGWARYATEIPHPVTAITPHDGTLVALTAVPRRLWRLEGDHWLPMSDVLEGGPDLLVSHLGDLYVGSKIWDGTGLVDFLHANGPVTSATTYGDLIVFGGTFTVCGGDTLGSLVAWDGAQVTRPWPEFGWPVHHLSAYDGQLIAIARLSSWGYGRLVYRFAGDSWVLLPFPPTSPEIPVPRFTLWHEGQLHVYYREQAWEWYCDRFRRWNGDTWVDVAGTDNALNAAASTGSGIVLLGTDLRHEDTYCGTVARRPDGSDFGMLVPLPPVGSGFGGGGVRHIDNAYGHGVLVCGEFRGRGDLYTPNVIVYLFDQWIPLPFDDPYGGSVAHVVGLDTLFRVHARICDGFLHSCLHYVWNFVDGYGWQYHPGALIATAKWFGASATTVYTLYDSVTIGTCDGGVINALHVMSGSGSLVAGGTFTHMSGTPVSKISRRIGAQWQAFPSPIGGSVTAMTDVSGSMVIAGRKIDPHGPDAYQVAEWANDSWRLMGGAFNGEVRTLEYHGGYVFAGGDFTSVGGMPISRLAGWDGEAWRPVGSGCNGTVWSLLSQGSQLLIGGGFTRGGGKPAGGMTSWVFQEISTNVPHAEVPSSLVLHAPGPNPFNPMTTVSFDLPQSSRVDLSVFDLRGRRLATLIADDLTAGSHSATWRGTDQQGRAVASGVYLIRLQAGNEAATRRVSLIR